MSEWPKTPIEKPAQEKPPRPEVRLMAGDRMDALRFVWEHGNAPMTEKALRGWQGYEVIYRYAERELGIDGLVSMVKATNYYEWGMKALTYCDNLSDEQKLDLITFFKLKGGVEWLMGLNSRYRQMREEDAKARKK